MDHQQYYNFCNIYYNTDSKKIIKSLLEVALTSVGLGLDSLLFKAKYSLCFLKLETDDLSKLPIVVVLNNAINFFV